MAFPPGVTIKDFQSDVSQGYPNPKPGGQPARFPTIIQIVPVDTSEVRHRTTTSPVITPSENGGIDARDAQVDAPEPAASRHSA